VAIHNQKTGSDDALGEACFWTISVVLICCIGCEGCGLLPIPTREYSPSIIERAISKSGVNHESAVIEAVRRELIALASDGGVQAIQDDLAKTATECRLISERWNCQIETFTTVPLNHPLIYGYTKVVFVVNINFEQRGNSANNFKVAAKETRQELFPGLLSP
jgi:hypothetical protein